METKVLNNKVIARLAELGSQIVGLINTGTPVRIWNGEKDVVNPTTGEVKGKRATTNLDIAVPESLYSAVEKGIEAAKNSGHYIEAIIAGQKLVAIKARYDEMQDRHIVQFSKPNTGSWTQSNSSEFNAKLAKAFGEAEASMKVSNTSAAPAATDDECPF